MFDLRSHLANGARSAGELVKSLGISRGTLSNAFRREASQIRRIGRARATWYAGRQTLAGLDTDEFPVFRVDEAGAVHSAGQLLTLAANQSVWLPDETILDGLPAQLHDVAPKGFLGRSFARHHPDLRLPEDLNFWSDHHVLIALSRRGEDLPGNLLVGAESFNRFQNLRHRARAMSEFPSLISAVLAGEHVGSSAGGEQPKFAALVDGQHRIIKFATDETDNARRWSDLLTLEHVALETLRAAGIAAAETQLRNIRGLRCLVVNRFDRIGGNGRRSVVSLAAASGQFDRAWTDAAVGLHQRGELSDESLQKVALLDAFGALIANTDRHQYNVLLYSADTGFTVAPAFDQLPMAYAPPASGNLRNTAIAAPRPTANTLSVWDKAQDLAAAFWRSASEQKLSDSMTAIVWTHRSR